MGEWIKRRTITYNKSQYAAWECTTTTNKIQPLSFGVYSLITRNELT